MNKTSEQEKQAAYLAQLQKAVAEELASPSYIDRMRLIARDRRERYLANIEAGFTEAQALELCRF